MDYLLCRRPVLTQGPNGATTRRGLFVACRACWLACSLEFVLAFFLRYVGDLCMLDLLRKRRPRGVYDSCIKRAAVPSRPSVRRTYDQISFFTLSLPLAIYTISLFLPHKSRHLTSPVINMTIACVPARALGRGVTFPSHAGLCNYTTSQPASLARNHRVVVIGAGAAGLSLSHQLLRSGNFAPKDIAVVDPAQWHHYQPGWTLVGGNLKNKEDLRKPLAGLINPKLQFYNNSVASFNPDQNTVVLNNGDSIFYENLVVAPGISINYDSIKGLSEALADKSAPVSTIYGYETCDKVFDTISNLKKGTAIFTHPAGVVKCAGAPQKAMWLALDYWKKAGLYKTSADSPINISFATGLPVMFGVPKYSAKLNELREQRNVEGLFQHDLVSVDGDKATFVRVDTKEHVTRRFDLLHVVPKMGPHKFIRESQLVDGTGFVDVDDSTLRHNTYPNIWAAGDSASLPTSKTAAAITAQVPVLVRNLLQSIDKKTLDASYNGYTSCPLLTEYNKVMLAEFGYGAKPMETFGRVLDQSVPRRAFYHLKKDFFPWVYFNAMVKGLWGGPKGFIR